LETTKIKLREVYSLEKELAGVSNTQTGEVVAKGLLAEKLKLPIKFHLTNLLKKVTAEKETAEKLREETMKKYLPEGVENLSIYIFEKDSEGKDTTTPKEVNPDFIAYDKEFGELLNQEIEISHFKFTLDHLPTEETEGNYPTFYTLIKETE
jgi:hypothetical protein